MDVNRECESQNPNLGMPDALCFSVAVYLRFWEVTMSRMRRSVQCSASSDVMRQTALQQHVLYIKGEG